MKNCTKNRRPNFKVDTATGTRRIIATKARDQRPRGSGRRSGISISAASRRQSLARSGLQIPPASQKHTSGRPAEVLDPVNDLPNPGSNHSERDIREIENNDRDCRMNENLDHRFELSMSSAFGIAHFYFRPKPNVTDGPVFFDYEYRISL